MQKIDAVTYLAGIKKDEIPQADAPTNIHIITGEVSEDSEDGVARIEIDGFVISGDDDDEQSIEIDTLGGLEEGDTATILLAGETGKAMTPLAIGAPGSIDRMSVRISEIEADYIKTTQLEAAEARIGDLEADHVSTTDLNAATARIGDLEADHVSTTDLNAATGRIATLEANDVTINGRLDAAEADIDDLEAEDARIGNLVATKADITDLNAATARIGDLEADHVSTTDLNAAEARIGTIEADYLKAADMTAEQARVGTLLADYTTTTDLQATYATITNLNAATGRISTLEANDVTISGRLTAAEGNITNLQSSKADISVLESDYITADAIEAAYTKTDFSNTDVAWIQNGVIKDGSISSAMINDVSANKLTAGTINGSVINVTNLNADNITTGTINGQRIGEGSLSLSKLEDDVYTESEVDSIVSNLQTQIDGAIETWTGTAVPTLSNQPASSWTTNAIKDTHVGDVYFVVNSNSQQNGYNYRFTKSGNTYSWQLIKDSDVTNALQRLSTAEGKITTFDSDISQLKTDTGTLTTKTTSLETRMSDAESDILDKVDTTTFNEVSDTVDSHSQSISQMSTTLSNKADSSTVSSLTTRVSKNEQDISGINTTIGSMQTTIESKADGSTVSTISNKLNTVSDTVDGHTQSISSITSTQTTMQGKLDKTLVETTQLWFSKANTTAPNKPTAQVTSTSTAGNAWRTVVPAYNASYPNYYYCYQWKYSDGTYGWSSVTRDIAMGESQERARTAITDAAAAQSTADTANTNASNAVSTANTASTNASTALSTANTAASDASDAKADAATAVSTANTANTNASAAVSTANTASTNASTAVSTANTAKSTADTAKATADKNVKSTTQLWFTKANETAPAKPTAKVTSTAVSGNGWRVVVPTYASDYPYYFYCYQYELADGTFTWSDVVYDRATTENQSNSRSAVSGVSTLTTKTNTIQDTVDGHTQSLQSITQTQTSIQQNAVKSTVQLWFTKANTTAPNKPTAHVTTNNAATGNAWNLAVPTYNSSYPNYYYCYEYQYVNDSYGWSAVTRDIATGEMQERARTAITNAAAADTKAGNAATAASTAQATANKNVKESQQLWFTKANSTAPGKPTSKVTSTSTSGNAWTTKVPTYSSSYPHYFYCMQYVAADGTVTWSDVVYDQATTEAQSVARTASANLSTLQQNYATFKQTTEEFESTVGATYATKSELEDATDDISAIETRVSNNETSISNNATNIALKANSSDVYTKTQTDGLISTEVTNRNSAIEASASAINLSVSQTYTTKTEFNNLEIGGRNLFSWPLSGTKWKDEEHALTTYQNKGSFTQFTGSLLFDPSETVGEQYTISFWAKSPNGSTPLYLYNSNGLPKYFYFINVVLTNTLGNEWEYFTCTVTNAEYSGTGTPSTNENYWRRIEIYAPNQIGVLVKKIKVEKGNKATDWTPAPEELEARVSSAETTIEQTANNVLIKATQSDTTAAQGGQHLIQSLINVAPSGVKIAASKVEIDGTAVFNAIKSSTDAAYDAKGAAATVQTNLDNMGSDNKIVNGAFVRDVDNWAAWGSPTTRNRVQVNGKWWMHCVTTATVYQGYSQNHYTSLGVTVEPSTKYTVGITARGGAAGTKVCVGFHWFAPSGTSIVSQSWLSFTVGTTAARQYQTVTVPSGIDHFNVMVGQNVATAQEFWITDITLVKGAVNQEWSESSALATHANGTANAAAPKSSAVKRTQRIWYRKSAAGAPATPGTASSNWVTKADDGDNAWTKMHVAISSSAKYIYTCEQYEMANGTVGYTSVLLDNTITVIDGGNIITGSVTANKLNASDINASKSLTVGAMTDDAAATILNSNVQVGGRNLFSDSKVLSTAKWTFEVATRGDNLAKLAANENSRIYQLPANGYWSWKPNTEYVVSVEAKASASGGKIIFNMVGAGGNKTKTVDLTTSWARYSWAFASDATVSTGSASIFNGTNTGTVQVRLPKLEEGNKATDWSPAPEDVAASAVNRTQRIYYRTAASKSSWTMPSAWLTTVTDVRDQWTCKVPRLTANADGTGTKYLYLYTCEQREMADGNIAYTTVLLDDSTTIIDGGTIITGSVSANAVNANSGTFNVANIPDLNASKITAGDIAAARIQANVISAINNLTAGQIDAARINASQLTIGSFNTTLQNTISNDKMNIGGTNLFVDTDHYLTTLNGSAFGGENSLEKVIPEGETITVSVEINADNLVWSSSGNKRIGCEMSIAKTGGGSQYIGAWAGAALSDSLNVVEVINGSMHKRISKTFTLLGDVSVGRNMTLYIQAVESGTVSIGRVKVERGNKPTDWTPAPEDVAADISDAAKTATNYIEQDSTGIKIRMTRNTSTYQHQSSTGTKFYVDGAKRSVISGDGLKVYIGSANSEVSVAEFGSAVRIGPSGSGHLSIGSDTIAMYGNDGVIEGFSVRQENGDTDSTVTIGIAGGKNTGVLDGPRMKAYYDSSSATSYTYVESGSLLSDASAGVSLSAQRKWTTDSSKTDDASFAANVHKGGVSPTASMTVSSGDKGAGIILEASASTSTIDINTDKLRLNDVNCYMTHGNVGQTINATKNAVTTYPSSGYLSYGHDYGTNIPDVVVGFNSGSTAAGFGGLSIAVSDRTATGFKVKIFNNTNTDRSPGFYWIAMG